MKNWKKYLVLLLTVTMCASTVGFECRAEEQTTEEQEESEKTEETEETTEEQTEELPEEELTEAEVLEEIDGEDQAEESRKINYVYVESSEIAAGNTQNIVFNVGEAENETPEAAKLLLTDPEGEMREIEAAKEDGNLLLFSIPIEDTDAAGSYTLKKLEYAMDGQKYTEALEDSWSYKVTDGETVELNTYESQSSEEGVIASEDAISEDSLDQALESLESVAAEEGVTVDITRYNKNSDGDLVVVLDPGHDSSHSGAVRGNLKEQDITLDIAWYAKDALEEYSGVKVYMTRTSDACPNGGGTTKNCLLYRTNYAKSVNADLFVSIHINSTGASTTTSKGAMVFVPVYSAYNGTMTSLSKKILNELNALGLKNNGVKVNADDHTNGKYDDGNWQDDYSVIRNSVLNGFPGILIEHAFINNAGDQIILASDAMLKKIGTGDAEAIAEHYGLTKGLTEEQKEQIRKFVNRMYEKVLSREYDQEGQNYWSNLLINQKITGAYLAEKFVFSPEFESRNLDNTAFLQILYEAFFDRTADADGLAYWSDLLEKGVSRKGVCGRFIMSQEFTAICSSYGITKGSITYTEERDKNVNVTSFVYRCYSKTLDRAPDTDGLNYWTGVINNKKAEAKAVAGKFVFSQEFKNKNLNDTEYVKALYRVFMGREYDEDGLKYWTGKLSAGSTREAIFESFSNSKEFTKILQSFGL